MSPIGPIGRYFGLGLGLGFGSGVAVLGGLDVNFAFEVSIFDASF